MSITFLIVTNEQYLSYTNTKLQLFTKFLYSLEFASPGASPGHRKHAFTISEDRERTCNDMEANVPDLENMYFNVNC